MKKQIFKNECETKLLAFLAMASLAFAFFSTACSPKQQPQKQAEPGTAMEKDVHSFANPSDAVVSHLDLDAAVDFDKKQIQGKASLHITNKTAARKLYLDTNNLTIQRVTLDASEAQATFALGDEVKYLGRPLVVDILPETKQVNVYYNTNPNASALQWLEPSQTAGKQKPFLFTHSQAILARTWVPCQDTPGVRMTYHAKIKTRPDLMAVMSATNVTAKNAEGVYEFNMPQPVPAYLLALAVGDIDFRPIGPRSGVYSEPGTVDKAAWELADLEKMIAAAESLYGPYRWERYDVIVLPPSFPFGGMENPRLTFATPTMMAGDRSLVSLIAHELAHSWSGNLVTNATWNDFWLNEGFTVYFERRIMEALQGREYSEMLAQLGYQSLADTVAEKGAESADTRLRVELEGRDPDEATSDIAYEKGYYFLRLIEETVGRDRLDAFLRKYFDTFAFQSMTTSRFVSYLKENLTGGDKAIEDRVQIDSWVNGPGIPANCPKVKSSQFEAVEAQVKAWQEGTPAKGLKTDGWTSHHWVHFIRNLPQSLGKARMQELDGAFNFTNTGNSEILNVWLLAAIQNKYEAAYPALEKFLTGMGRRKFLKPLYTELAKSPEGTEMARNIYAKARPTYHPVSYTTIDEILKWQQP